MRYSNVYIGEWILCILWSEKRMKFRNSWKMVGRRIVERILVKWLGRYYLECKWSVRIDNVIENLIFKLEDEWFVE